MLDSGAEGPGFKSQSRRCRVTVLGKLFTPIVTEVQFRSSLASRQCALPSQTWNSDMHSPLSHWKYAMLAQPSTRTIKQDCQVIDHIVKTGPELETPSADRKGNVLFCSLAVLEPTVAR